MSLTDTRLPNKKDRSFYSGIVPRLTENRRSARRQQIVDAARQCFLEDGFQATSMKDILSAAQLSAGAVYNYFASKDDLIVAISQEALAEVAGTFERMRESELPPLDEALTTVFAHRPPMNTQRESAKLLVQVWAESLRSPTLSAKVVPIFEGVRDVFAELVTAYQKRGTISAAVAPETVGDVLLATLHGIILRRAMIDDVDIDALRDGLRAVFPTGTPHDSNAGRRGLPTR
ncbi:MAG: TetR/AcrR family transcriptional regulator, transcriptional repressor of aconitase [Mycobacterium sp.]